jgi:dolichyl-phosphate-mannose--protein O-mannosyl transferase
MISSAVSVKFVGLFVVILVGTRTAADLWDVLGDLSKPIVSNIYFKLKLCLKHQNLPFVTLLDIHNLKVSHDCL